MLTNKLNSTNSNLTPARTFNNASSACNASNVIEEDRNLFSAFNQSSITHSNQLVSGHVLPTQTVATKEEASRTDVNNDKAPTNNSNAHESENQLHNSADISTFFQESLSLEMQISKSLDNLYEYSDKVLNYINETKKETDPIAIKNELSALAERIPPNGKDLEDLSLVILRKLYGKFARALLKLYCKHHSIILEIEIKKELKGDLFLSLFYKFRPLTKMHREIENKYSCIDTPTSDTDIYE